MPEQLELFPQDQTDEWTEDELLAVERWLGARVQVCDAKGHSQQGAALWVELSLVQVLLAGCQARQRKDAGIQAEQEFGGTEADSSVAPVPGTGRLD